MAMDHRKTKIEYIRYYTPGSAAQVLEPLYPAPGQSQRPHKKARQEAQPVKAIRVCLDPLSLLAIVVAVVMVAAMVAGVQRLKQADQELQAMASYVESLKTQRQTLTATFEETYDAEAVEKAALSLGMIPVEEAAHLQVQLAPQELETAPEPTIVDKLYTFFTGLFA